MPVEIFYFRDAQGRSAIEERLNLLTPKALARSLAQIDLLEPGEALPAKLDQDAARAAGQDKGQASPAQGMLLRVLIVRNGHNRAQYYYIQPAAGQLILLDAAEGKKTGAQLIARMSEKGARATASDLPASALKSHREYVAEATLGDSDLAALYARARERAGFALALIRLREASQHTPDSLAERTGLSRELILRIERASHLPKLPALRRLADALQTQIVITPGAGLSMRPIPAEPLPTHPARPGRAKSAKHPTTSAANREPVA